MRQAESPVDDPQSLLRQFGRLPDEEIDLAAAGLALAALARPGSPLAPYREHLRAVAEDVAGAMPRGTAALPERIRTLNTVLFETHGYRGDRDTYDDLRNANLMSVIDRRRGLPIALGIIYVHAARAQGWSIEGVNFPGHFLLRLREGQAATIVDPFSAGRICATSDLRALIKATEGDGSELKPEHCQAAGNRQMLLRLQNNIKLRLLRDDKPADAAEIIERMILIAPDDVGLWHEFGVLQGRLGKLRSAIAALETMVELSRGSPYLAGAMSLLTEMKSRLN